MSLEEKYGALGTVIGHEISHAFDTNGAQYDAEGNVKKWWTRWMALIMISSSGQMSPFPSMTNL